MYTREEVVLLAGYALHSTQLVLYTGEEVALVAQWLCGSRYSMSDWYKRESCRSSWLRGTQWLICTRGGVFFVDGSVRVDGYAILVAAYAVRVASCIVRVASYVVRVAGYWLRIANCLRAAGYLLRVAGNWLRVVGSEWYIQKNDSGTRRTCFCSLVGAILFWAWDIIFDYRPRST